MASLRHPWFTTTNLSYRFPIFETSATALCGTTGMILDICILVSICMYTMTFYVWALARVQTYVSLHNMGSYTKVPVIGIYVYLWAHVCMQRGSKWKTVQLLMVATTTFYCQTVHYGSHLRFLSDVLFQSSIRFVNLGCSCCCQESLEVHSAVGYENPKTSHSSVVRPM